MKSTPASVAAALLRGITDEIASGAQASTGRESISELIERVRGISKQAHTRMRSALGAAFPEIGWNNSEDKHNPSAGAALYWVYDPIDGAYHYLQGLPLWSSSLALIKDGRAVLALVYDPCQRELFIAEDGKGTTLNGLPVKTSSKVTLQTAVVGTALPPMGSGSPDEHALAAKLLVETSKHVFVIRQMAAASLQLAYVAAGRLDAYVETGKDVYDWMAGCLLVQEASGMASALDRTPFDVTANGILATAAGLHNALHERLVNVIEADV